MNYSKKRIINKEIPDSNANGLKDVIKFHRNLTVKNITLSVNVKHPYNGDISVNLTGPNGVTVAAHKATRKSGTNLVMSFSGEKFNDFVGIKSKGDWTIQVVDSGLRDSGSLVDWMLDFDLANAKKSEVFIVDETDLVSSQYCHQGGSIKDLTAHVTLQHGYVGDLVLNLTSPSGKMVTLQDRIGGGQKDLNKTYNADVLADMIGETATGKWTMKISDTMPRDNGALVKWSLKMVTGSSSTSKSVGGSTAVASSNTGSSATATRDDLTKIEGIGPKIASLLNDDGINTWSQLAASTVNRLQGVLNAAGNRYKIHNPGSWPSQADLAANGKWDELNVLQDELDGGK